MKILIISSGFDRRFGGAAAVPMMLVRELRRRGYRTVVVTTGRARRTTTTERDGVRVYSIGPHNLHWIGDKDRYSTWRRAAWQVIDYWNIGIYTEVKRIIETERPDVVHVHKLRGLSPAVWAAAGRSNCPRIVQTCHDYELISPEGTLTSRIGRLAAEGHWLLAPYQGIRAVLSNAVPIVTAPSRYTLNAIASKGLFKHASRIVIPNSHGISSADLERAAENGRSESPRPRRELRLLFLGRLEKIKGVQLLCEAVVNCTSRNVRLDIAGWGSLAEGLERQYRSEPRVAFHGAVFGQEKESLIRSADAVVVPSIWPEVFGIVVIEAFAYGKPVIGSDCGGIPELITEGRTGFVVPAGDADALRRRIAMLSEDRGPLDEMREQCRAAALQFASDRVAEQYIQVYEELG